MKRFLRNPDASVLALCAAIVLALASIPVGCATVPQSPPVAPAVARGGIIITFQSGPTPATAQALTRAGAAQTINPLVWTIASFDFHDQTQVQAIHAALSERASLGPQRQ